jgi:hypothetical protein
MRSKIRLPFKVGNEALIIDVYIQNPKMTTGTAAQPVQYIFTVASPERFGSESFKVLRTFGRKLNLMT